MIDSMLAGRSLSSQVNLAQDFGSRMVGEFVPGSFTASLFLDGTDTTGEARLNRGPSWASSRRVNGARKHQGNAGGRGANRELRFVGSTAGSTSRYAVTQDLDASGCERGSLRRDADVTAKWIVSEWTTNRPKSPHPLQSDPDGTPSDKAALFAIGGLLHVRRIVEQYRELDAAVAGLREDEHARGSGVERGCDIVQREPERLWRNTKSASRSSPSSLA
jgi:hypothetical protein